MQLNLNLDVGSIEALQNMLAKFPGAVLLVTHDKQLANAVAQTRWKVERNGETFEVRAE